MLCTSKTSLLTAWGYAAGAGIYWVWHHDKLIASVLLMCIAISMIMICIVLATDPESFLALLGKDVTLTGRTGLWTVVFELIAQKPMLGWGYRAVWQATDVSTIRADEIVGWAVPSSHNGFLEIALQLGWVGVAAMALMLAVAVWRSLCCCLNDFNPLGWISLMFFLSMVAVAQTLDNLAQNQVIDWVVFNILLFSCGLQLRYRARFKR